MLTPTQQLQLETSTFNQIDPENSYLALKWNFSMSLKSKVEDKSKDAKHPSFLVYYSFGLHQPKQPLQVIGVQASSIRGL